jgi:hypothetical protein
MNIEVLNEVIEEVLHVLQQFEQVLKKIKLIFDTLRVQSFGSRFFELEPKKKEKFGPGSNPDPPDSDPDPSDSDPDPPDPDPDPPDSDPDPLDSEPDPGLKGSAALYPRESNVKRKPYP